MKFAVDQQEFAHAIATISRAVPSRATHPILSNLLLSAEGHKVSLLATNLSLAIKSPIAAEVEKPGSFTLPARLLSEIVSKLPHGQVVVNLEDGVQVSLECLSGRFQVRGIDPGEYPEVPLEIAPESAVTLPTDLLVKGVKFCGCPSTDETKQILTGIKVSIGGGILEMAVTDGHRLGVFRSEVEVDQDREVVIPARAMTELTRIIAAEGTGTVTMALDPTTAIFQWGDRFLSTRVLDGAYPNYRQLIPAQFGLTFTCDRRSLLSALDRVAVLASQANNVVRLKIDGSLQQVFVSVETADVGTGSEAVPAQVTGETIEMAFNVKYLLDGLKGFDSQAVQFQGNTPTSPVVLRPLGGEDALYLCMPVQIRQ